jgi:hypothetical protein
MYLTILVNFLALKFRDLLPEWHAERAYASFAHSAEAQALRRGLCFQSSNIFQWRYAFESSIQIDSHSWDTTLGVHKWYH